MPDPLLSRRLFLADLGKGARPLRCDGVSIAAGASARVYALGG